MSFLSKIYALLLFFNRGSQRSILVKKNAIGGLLLKGGDVIVSLLLVRETLNYLDVYQYGVWLTLSSILNWINFCNVGLGNGLRNRLGEAIAKDDLESARGYVSTAFICIFAIAASIFLLVVLSSPFISWVRILNIDANEFPRVEFYVPLMILLFLFDFIIKHVGVIYTAYMIPTVRQLFASISNFLVAIVICLLIKIKGHGSFVEVGLIFISIPIVIHIIAYCYTFMVRYPKIAPSLKFFNRHYVRDMLGMGVLFFILQMFIVIMFFSSNIIISHLFTPAEVTPYNIAYRYFSSAFMFWGAAIYPLWSAVTNAYSMNDFDWIKKTIHRLNLFGGLVAVLILIMLIVSPLGYRIWIGNTVSIDFSLSMSFALLMIILVGYSICSSFINGIGKIRLQVYMALANIVLFPILGVLFGRLFGVIGLVIVQSVLLFAYVTVLYIQTYKILNHTASGIWSA